MRAVCIQLPQLDLQLEFFFVVVKIIMYNESCDDENKPIENYHLILQFHSAQGF